MPTPKQLMKSFPYMFCGRNIAIAKDREYYTISVMELSEQFYWKK